MKYLLFIIFILFLIFFCPLIVLSGKKLQNLSRTKNCTHLLTTCISSKINNKKYNITTLDPFSNPLVELLLILFIFLLFLTVQKYYKAISVKNGTHLPTTRIIRRRHFYLWLTNDTNNQPRTYQELWNELKDVKFKLWRWKQRGAGGRFVTESEQATATWYTQSNEKYLLLRFWSSG